MPFCICVHDQINYFKIKIKIVLIQIFEINLNHLKEVDFRGLVPHLLHVTPNVCIIFAVYESVMSLWWSPNQSTMIIFFNSSKIISVISIMHLIIISEMLIIVIELATFKFSMFFYQLFNTHKGMCLWAICWSKEFKPIYTTLFGSMCTSQTNK